ncbi:uncharacterized protein [Rutidosis leptorrhynchoides]|uniref:uncharacterized protein n=1 Tax=Rutidosis leptorrhynchoides TaxID=125765 RepID=UPI003A98FF0B
MCPDNINRNNWQWPEIVMTGEKRPLIPEEYLPDHKRLKSSSSQTVNEWSLDSKVLPVSLSDYNPLNEPGPLGLNLKKSPSLLELIQSKINQANSSNCVLPTENTQEKNIKARVEKPGTSGPVDKLKASNFQALSLRIGNWEYVSRHEGDLVAKCYFAKHKLVWEVLDGGLKNKIEIQWSDIVGLKANCPDKGPGLLTIVLGKPPQFFRETDPQPRKHTLWQATSDFTGGEAITCRQHYLQCSQGVLNKHYEKLIQCDTRLNFLSQQQEKVFDSPFAQNVSVQAPNVLYNNGPLQLKYSKGLYLYDIKAKGTNADLMKEYGYVESASAHGSKINREVETLNPQGPRSISGIVNRIGHCISEKGPAQIVPFIDNVLGGVKQDDMLENMSQLLLNDTQLNMESDETLIMKKVNSLYNLFQTENEYHNPSDEMNLHHVNGWHDVNDYSTLDFSPMFGITSDNNECFGMPRNDSFTDLLHQLPRIASLPRLLFDI